MSHTLPQIVSHTLSHTPIIDALFSIPQHGPVVQISDCIPFLQDLAPGMKAAGISGAVIAHGNCSQCQYEWNCANRKTHEIAALVAHSPGRLRGLAAYDCLRVAESMRWIDETVHRGELAGAYLRSESCCHGLDSPRMYPLYGMCSMLAAPLVLEFGGRERWLYQRPQLEMVAADFPDMDLLVAVPPHTELASLAQLMKRFPRMMFLLGPRELLESEKLCELLEADGSRRVLFRSAGEAWPLAVRAASEVPLGPVARRAYLGENAARIFGFQMQETATLSA